MRIHNIFPPIVLLAGLLLLPGILSMTSAEPSERGVQDPEPEGPAFAGYDPSPVFPNGRPNPDAPAEITQFHFMIGENACLDRIRQPDGSYREFPTRWNARYFLNGFGIQDQYWADSFATTNLRIFDPDSQSWKVTFARMPGYFVGTWEGSLQGEEIILQRIAHEQNHDRPSTGRLVFFDISEDGFEWKAETLVEGEYMSNWTASCTKVR